MFEVFGVAVRCEQPVLRQEGGPGDLVRFAVTPLQNCPRRCDRGRLRENERKLSLSRRAIQPSGSSARGALQCVRGAVPLRARRRWPRSKHVSCQRHESPRWRFAPYPSPLKLAIASIAATADNTTQADVAGQLVTVFLPGPEDLTTSSAAASRRARTLIEAMSESVNPSSSNVLAVSIPNASLSARTAADTYDL